MNNTEGKDQTTWLEALIVTGKIMLVLCGVQLLLVIYAIIKLI